MLNRAFGLFFLALTLGLIWTAIVFIFGNPAEVPSGVQVLIGAILVVNGGLNFAIMRRSRHPWFRFLRPLNVLGTFLGLVTIVAPGIAIPIVRWVLVLYCGMSAERAFSGIAPKPRG